VHLLDSLIDAILRYDGDALIMHVGDKPYVVTGSSLSNPRGGPTGWSQVEVSSRLLTRDTMADMIEQLLQPADRRALDARKAIEIDVPPSADRADRYRIIVVRGVDEIWLEVRRRRNQAAPVQTIAAPAVENAAPAVGLAEPAEEDGGAEPSSVLDGAAVDEAEEAASEEEVEALLAATATALLVHGELGVETPAPVRANIDAHRVAPVRPASPPAPQEFELAERPAPQISAAPENGPSGGRDHGADVRVQRLLQAAVAAGASVVYAVAQSRPMARMDGEIGPLPDESVLTKADVEDLIREVEAFRGQDERSEGAAEWMCDVPGVGRARYLTFRDHRGPGLIFRLTPPRAISAAQLGLPPEVQALAQQADGLVLVAGSPGSGKSTLLRAFVDLINRSRSEHVITIESPITFLHETARSFISQREVSSDPDRVVAAARQALEENPDVLFMEELASSDAVSVALEAAERGCLVFGAIQAASSIAALDRLVDMFPADRRASIRGSLAGALRAVVAQVLLRKARGGRIAAREVLLNSPAVASLLLEGKTFQLSAAMEAGRARGMIRLADSLSALVREGIVQVDEAYRKAVDRDALLASLKREGIDTTFAERLA
jgi:twitching motility protein PilT